ncbi:NTP transferase domain-containing protein [Methylocystis sp. SC2]|uniref:nucleotidyltransferase family protein n=1 Tax=Methylocystis sp. (strain SC2) TaxID=187303 RepID=UPI00027AF15A|nr:nucleotidyltransferase family protein [Methylocystis sp. SC2]CCJ08893.1 4-diphosphocytidyl-2C-methyl-D-erythritol synthase [Methylocystis sp. SC2]
MTIAAVLLAAGASKRFGEKNKLLCDLGGKPLIRRVAEAVVCSGVDVVVVTGCDRARIEKVLEGLPLRLAHNLNWESGMGSSIAVGVSALGQHTPGAFVVPGDLPFLTSDLIKELTAVFLESRGALITYPTTSKGEQRNPVLWPRRFFPSLAALSGALGARQLLQNCENAQKQAHVLDEGVFIDVDAPADMEAVRSRWNIANP